MKPSHLESFTRLYLREMKVGMNQPPEASMLEASPPGYANRAASRQLGLQRAEHEASSPREPLLNLSNSGDRADEERAAVYVWVGGWMGVGVGVPPGDTAARFAER